MKLLALLTTAAAAALVAGGAVAQDVPAGSQAPIDIVRRGDIREIRTDGLSLMPDGLEQGLEFQDLADLLAFLQQREQ